MTEKLLTAADLAEILGVSQEKVMEWRRVFDWPHVRIGRRFRWTPEQVEQIVAQHAVPSQKPERRPGGPTARSMARKRVPA